MTPDPMAHRTYAPRRTPSKAMHGGRELPSMPRLAACDNAGCDG